MLLLRLIVLLSLVMNTYADSPEFIQTCKDLEESSKDHKSTGGFRFVDYENPEGLSLEQLREDIEDRKEKLKIYMATEAIDSITVVPLKLDLNISFNFTSIVTPFLDCLHHFQDPDFIILPLVRILYQTREFDEQIIPVLQSIPMWLTEGEDLRVYWSENHIIMYTSHSYLLQQKFPEKFSGEDDPDMRSRLLWFLENKASNGYFEFNSHIYMPLTMAALLNLHDLSEEAEIVDLARRCVLRLLEEWLEVTNTFGVSSSVAGRSYQFYFYKGEIPSNHSRLYGWGGQEVMALATGLGPLVVEGEYFACTAFLSQSSIDIAPAVATYKNVLYKSRSIGASPENRDAFFEGLTKKDRFVAQMSMGGYAHPDYVNDFISLIGEYDMWDHPMFSSYELISYLHPDMVKSFSSLIGSITLGSVLHVPDIRVYKNHQVTLTSLPGYYSGHKGYQQVPWAAIVGDASVYTQAMGSLTFNTSDATNQFAVNDQMPFLVQEENVLLTIYNPNADLQLLGVKGLDIVFFFDGDQFDEIVDDHKLDSKSKWLFARQTDGYIAVYRHCVEEDEFMSICSDEKQIWITVVGNNLTHGSFSSFQSVIRDNSEVNSFESRKCIRAEISVDGINMDEFFCRRLGNVNVFIIVLVFYLICLFSCCFVCCRRKRRVWKRVVGQSKKLNFFTSSTEKDESEISDHKPEETAVSL